MKTIVEMRFGSHVYGTSVPTSDADWKAVFLPPPREILLGTVVNNITRSTKEDSAKTNTAADTDYEAFSLGRYVELLLEGQTVAFDMLFTPASFYVSEPHAAWLELQRYRENFLHRGVAAMARYCQRQAAKYGMKGSRIAALREVLAALEPLEDSALLKASLPVWEALAIRVSGVELIRVKEAHRTNPGLYLEVCDRKVPLEADVRFAKKVFKKTLAGYGDRALQAEQNHGVDWKAVMHAVRVASEATELVTHRRITFPRPEAALLLRIRRGEMPYPEVEALIEQGLETLEKARAASTLPEAPDRARAESFLCRHYRQEVLDGPTFVA